MPVALKVYSGGSASCEAPGKSFLVLFFKKELLLFSPEHGSFAARPALRFAHAGYLA
jgi:hypothetical protein